MTSLVNIGDDRINWEYVFAFINIFMINNLAKIIKWKQNKLDLYDFAY